MFSIKLPNVTVSQSTKEIGFAFPIKERIKKIKKRSPFGLFFHRNQTHERKQKQPEKRSPFPTTTKLNIILKKKKTYEKANRKINKRSREEKKKDEPWD